MGDWEELESEVQEVRLCLTVLNTFVEINTLRDIGQVLLMKLVTRS